jgi:tetratricopeptide (TPR) repeat protein
MRVVLAHHTIRVEELIRNQPLPGRAADEILCLGGPNSHLQYQPDNHAYSAIARQYRDGWKPDVYIHWSLEYNRVPEGLEEADCFLVGTVSDTFLGGRAVQAMGGAFDLLLTERSGIRGLQNIGFPNVYESSFFGYDPALHRQQEGVERDLDIVLIGNFNHEVQGERSRWLARVARLSRHYRVCLTTNVWGEEYVRLMNRARIVFNRSVSGAINMRVYEAAACGACLFYERENLEIRDLFTDRQECVLYSEEDLEELLHHYLTHEEERQQIAQNAHQKVKNYTYAHQIGRMLTTIERLRAEIPLYHNRTLRRLPIEERRKRLALHWMLATEAQGLVAADNALGDLQSQNPDNFHVYHMRGSLFGEWANRLQDRSQSTLFRTHAIHLMKRSLELNSLSPVAHLNLAHLYRENADTQASLQSIQTALQQLYAPCLPASSLAGPYYPRRYTRYDVELEKVYCWHAEGTETWQKQIRAILQWKAWTTLSELLLEIGRYRDAKEAAECAVGLRPECGATRGLLAKSLAGLGELDLSLEQYRCALVLSPLDTTLWQEYIQTLKRCQRLRECRAFIEDCLQIVNGCPPYEWVRDSLQSDLEGIARLERETRSVKYLAIVDWNDAYEWQSVIRFWSMRSSSETGSTLTLMFDPQQHPNLEIVVGDLERYVVSELSSSLDSLHDIVLSETRMTRESILQHIYQSQVVLSTPQLQRLVHADDLSMPGIRIEPIDSYQTLQEINV